jgi:NAD(P)-dependent dehydrogenase (short-subunit alcohol dehydrogenase family)
LAGKIAVVTGGSRGVGAAIGERLASEGATVVLAARSKGAGEVVANNIRATGGQAEFVSLDVTDESQWLALVDSIEQRHGGLHLLINNAGVHQIRDLQNCSGEDFSWLMNTNLLGPFLGMKTCIPLLANSGSDEDPARIINMSSVAALVPNARQALYNATKAGLDSMTKSVALEVAGNRQPITANTVNPGIIETEMGDELLGQLVREGIFKDAETAARYLKRDYAMRRFATAEDVATAVSFLCQPDSRYITGISLPVDGGYSRH